MSDKIAGVRVAEVRKALVAIVGFIANALAAGILPADAVPYAVAIISLATAAGVYGVKNEERAPRISKPVFTIDEPTR